MPLLSIDELPAIAPIFSGRKGRLLAKFIFHLLSVDRLNDKYDQISTLKGHDFTEAFLKSQGACYKVFGKDILSHLPDGPFITISNHPYGGIDGIILIDLLGHIRKDYKVMVNKILSRAEALEPNFICVIPNGDNNLGPQAESIAGVRKSLAHLRSGSALGFFPSGAISDLSLKDRCIRDREWQEPVLRLIKAAHVPIVPIRFFDRNSTWFYLLGLISWKIRLLRLPKEVINKGGKQIRLGIGPIITEAEQDACLDIGSFGRMLRKSVYDQRLSNSPDRSAD